MFPGQGKSEYVKKGTFDPGGYSNSLCLDLVTSVHLTSCKLVMDIKCMTTPFYDSVDTALFIYSEVF